MSRTIEQIDIVFPEYPQDCGRPHLRGWKYRKTTTVEWGEGSVLDEEGFAAAVNCAVMDAELREIWERYRAQPFWYQTALSIGNGVNGAMYRVPHAAGSEAIAVVRKYFAEALGSTGAEEKTRI